MKTSITKILSFDAAHSLPEHEGKCAGLHGHGYRLEVTVGGTLQTAGSAAGMVMDFGDLSDTIRRLVVDRLDHTYLNDVLDVVPTAEGIAGWVFAILREAGLPAERVRLWETPTSYADVSQ
jgi:6-pyruvoyltetrahydropterin/6-carboxytetrahydropterin synthase